MEILQGPGVEPGPGVPADVRAAQRGPDHPGRHRRRQRQPAPPLPRVQHHAGQAVLWQDEHTVDENLTLRAAPGHTPDLGVLELHSGDDPAQARASRHRVLSWAAEYNALVVPAHLGGAHAAEITPDGDGFAIKGWAQSH